MQNFFQKTIDFIRELYQQPKGFIPHGEKSSSF